MNARGLWKAAASSPRDDPEGTTRPKNMQLDLNRQDPMSIHDLWACHPYRYALGITVLWRIFIAAIGIAAHQALKPGPNLHTLINHGWSANLLSLATDASVRLDSYWYAKVALFGYRYNPHYISSIGYYPLYPVLIKLLSVVIGNVYVAGVLISTACVFLLITMLSLWLSDRGYTSKIVPVTLAVLLFPFSFFLAAMFTESLFLFLAVATFVAAERGSWSAAALFTALAVLTRPTGLALIPSLAVIYYLRRPSGWPPLLPLVSGAGAFAGFLLYQDVRFGTPFAYSRTHAAPPGYVTVDQAISDLTLHARPGMPSWYMAFMLAMALVFLACVPAVYKRFGPPYAVFVALSILLPMASTLPGMERYVIAAFPVFAVLGCTSHRVARFLITNIFFWLAIVFTAFFVAGYGIF